MSRPIVGKWNLLLSSAAGVSTIIEELRLRLHVDDGLVVHLPGRPAYQGLSRKGAQQPSASKPATKTATAATMVNLKSRYAAAAA
jgi:hypothetical protein